MLHQILLGLLGIKGGVIQQTEGIFTVRQDCYFLSKSERQLINKVLSVATHYKFLQAYAAKHGNLLSGIRSILHLKTGAQQQEQTSGLYLKAYCAGIQVLLDNYRSKIVSIQQEYLQGRTITIPALLQRIQADQLAAIARITKNIQSSRNRGAQLLDVVNTQEFCPALQKVVYDMLAKLLQVFFHQLTSWCIFGQLLDSFGEFFIKQQQGTAWTTKFGLQLDMLPMSCVSPRMAEKILFIGKAVKVLGDAFSLEEADEFRQVMGHVQCNFSKLLLSQVLERMRKAVGARLWNLVFVKSDLVGNIKAMKNYFLLARGEFILTFLDQSKQMMQLPPKPDTAQNDINQGPFAQAQGLLEEDPLLYKFSFTIKPSGFNFSQFSYAHDLSLVSNCRRIGNMIRLVSNRFFTRPGTIWYNRKQQILPGFSTQFTFRGSVPLTCSFMLQSEKQIEVGKQNAPISPHQFEEGLSVILRIEGNRAKVKLEVCRVVISQGIASVQPDLFTLNVTMQGDSVRVTLNNSLTIDTVINVQSLKLDVGASAYVGISAQTVVQLMSWAFVSTVEGQQAAVFDSWNGLGLTYIPEFPLDIIISPQILDKYTALFKFLFALRRAQFTIQRSWLKQAKSRVINKSALQLRAQMNFLLDNLMTFLQVDVIEGNYQKLMKNLDESSDFEQVRKFHDQYVISIAADCFLNAPRVVRAVLEIARSCHDLCGIIERGGDLESVRRRFEEESLFIFNVLSSVRNLHSALGQLLLRLDFNDYFTNLKGKNLNRSNYFN